MRILARICRNRTNTVYVNQELIIFQKNIIKGELQFCSDNLIRTNHELMSFFFFFKEMNLIMRFQDGQFANVIRFK